MSYDLGRMGNEATGRLVFDGVPAEVTMLLETEELIVRGELRIKIPFSELQGAAAEGELLRLRWNDHDIDLPVGAQAAKWLEKIRHPKSVLDKLGIKAGQRVSIAGAIRDEAFLTDLEQCSGDVSRRIRKASDVLFFAANARKDLGKLEKLKDSIKPNGAIWVIRPKGTPAISDTDVIAAGRAAGLVDVKVVRFSATHSAEKLVVPVTKR
ncbi:MAG: hypothetical protein JWO56_2999 [Acidobacteria bacterium]|nr:hypothetical protein [Acidobacteriota bacterium]